jgi:hypothetical protein
MAGEQQVSIIGHQAGVVGTGGIVLARGFITLEVVKRGGKLTSQHSACE